MPRVRFYRLAICMAVCLAAPFVPQRGTHAEDAAVKATPYEAWLPNPEWTESDPAIRYHAARIIDGLTEAPLAGATLAGYPEDLRMSTTTYAKRLASATTNRDGVASLRSPGEMLIEHWVARAPGYAPAVHFGYEPPTTMGLVRGAVIKGRVVGPTGKPLAGVTLDVFSGCWHAPSLGKAVTDAAGRFELPRCDPEVCTIWIHGPEGRPTFKGSFSELLSLDALGRDIILGPARTCTGQVLDAEGRPLVDVLVREGSTQLPETGQPWTADGRCVFTRTDARGRFTLAGLPELGEGCGLYVVLKDRDTLWVEVPNTLKPHVNVIVGGTPPEVLEAPVVPTPSVTARVAGDEGALRLLRAEDSDVWLSVVTAHTSQTVEAADLLAGRVQVPSEGDVALRTEDAIFAFGSARGGTREVTLRLRPERRVRIHAPFVISTVELSLGGYEIDYPELEDGSFLTTWQGPVTLIVSSEEGEDFRVPLVLGTGTEDVVVDVAKQGTPPVPAEPMLVSWRMADGRVPDDLHLTARRLDEVDPRLTVYGATSPEDEIEGACRVVLWREGLQPLRADLEPGEHELVWGAGVIEIDARDPEGKRVQSVIMIDGALHRDYGHEEPFKIEGLPLGPRRVVVTPLDVAHRGFELTLDIKTSATRHVVQFAKR